MSGFTNTSGKAKGEFENVADLKAAPGLKIGQRVTTLGYYTPGDGGGAEYIIVASGTGTDDGGSYHDLANGLQAKLTGQNIINVKTFGAVGSDIVDNSSALQNAINYAGALGTVLFPVVNKYYGYSTTLVVPGGQIWKGETDWLATRSGTDISALRYTGSAAAISSQELTIEKLVIRGTSAFNIGINTATGIEAAGNLHLVDTSIVNFAIAKKISGGFYHNFVGCLFKQNNLILKTDPALNANNIKYSGNCKLEEFDTFVEFSSGIGPVSLHQCSIESWTTKLTNALSGAKILFTLDQCYVENYPNTTIATGLTDTYGTGKYDLVFGIIGLDNISVSKTVVSLKGIRRWIYTLTGAENIRLDSNEVFVYEDGAAAPNQTENYVYITGSTSTRLESQDHFRFVDSTGTEVDYSTVVGVLTTEFINIKPYKYSYFDFDDRLHTNDIDATYQEISLVNGWANEATGKNLSWVVKNNTLYITGHVDGTVATADLMGSVPTSVLADAPDAVMHSHVTANSTTASYILIIDKATGGISCKGRASSSVISAVIPLNL